MRIERPLKAKAELHQGKALHLFQPIDLEILKDDGDEDVDDESGEDVDENPCLQSRVSIHSNLAEKQLPEENSDETDQLIIPGLTRALSFDPFL